MCGSPRGCTVECSHMAFPCLMYYTIKIAPIISLLPIEKNAVSEKKSLLLISDLFLLLCTYLFANSSQQLFSMLSSAIRCSATNPYFDVEPYPGLKTSNCKGRWKSVLEVSKSANIIPIILQWSEKTYSSLMMVDWRWYKKSLQFHMNLIIGLLGRIKNTYTFHLEHLQF